MKIFNCFALLFTPCRLGRLFKFQFVILLHKRCQVTAAMLLHFITTDRPTISILSFCAKKISPGGEIFLCGSSGCFMHKAHYCFFFFRTTTTTTTTATTTMAAITMPVTGLEGAGSLGSEGSAGALGSVGSAGVSPGSSALS